MNLQFLRRSQRSVPLTSVRIHKLVVVLLLNIIFAFLFLRPSSLPVAAVVQTVFFLICSPAGLSFIWCEREDSVSSEP